MQVASCITMVWHSPDGIVLPLCTHNTHTHTHTWESDTGCGHSGSVQPLFSSYANSQNCDNLSSQVTTQTCTSRISGLLVAKDGAIVQLAMEGMRVEYFIAV